jgi:acyl transferase domain-containing protein/NADPH:quinone reductase-like Zn-dependent oxidoreductase/acyl carrier protein
MQRADLPRASNRLAIVGLAFRFPGPGGDEFWSALREGRNLVGTVDGSRWSGGLFYHPSKSEPGRSYTRAGGSLGDVSGFDAAFFGISPREAAQLDPQQRLLLELTWEAFESAGIRPSSVRGSRASVHLGFSGSDYAQRWLDDFASVDAFSMTGVAGSIAANRISYFFDLRGPSMAVDTACSSSLVALHQACQSILAGESDLALTGAVNLHLHPFPYVAFSKASMLSRRGICSPFDAEGDGYVRSEGAAIVLVKRLEDAVAAGNRIHAVIAGSAVNSDGKTSSLTVPSFEAQANLLRDVYLRACIDPSEIDYLEAHGTGTAVGDPIEARALGEALGRYRPASLPLRIGSVKSNIGHLESASGMAGLVKAIYCLRHREVPPSVNFIAPNPRIAFDAWNLRVVTEATPLDPVKRLVIGVNSFGFGGANAHVVLESYTDERFTEAPVPGTPVLSAPLILSARSDEALRALARSYADWLRKREDLPLYDVAYSAAFHRDWLEHRAVFPASDRAAAAQALARFASGNASPEVARGRALAAPRGPVFLFSGNGAQWAGMGKRLVAESDVFRDAVQAVDRRFRAHADFSLLEAFGREDLSQLLEATEHAQPLLFAVQVGITELLATWGITPTAVLGHSVGEIAAAWACGALSLEQAVEVVFHRSAYQAPTRGAGAMTAVALDESAALELLAAFPAGARLALAAVNSPVSVTIAGAREDLDQLEARLRAQETDFRRLALDYAFHSPAMDGLEQGLMRSLAGLTAGAQRFPFYSAVTGEPLPSEALDAAYWWRNIREPVQFSRAMQHLIGGGASVFLEVGPQPVLRAYVSECLQSNSAQGRAIPTMMRSGDGLEALMEKAFQVLVAGGAADLSRLFPTKGRMVDLPQYAWQRERHWHASTSEAYDLINRRIVHPLLGYRLPGTDWEWENHLDTAILPALDGHRVGGEAVVPAAAFAEMALAAAAELQDADAYELEDMEIRAALVIDAQHSKTVRFCLDAADGRFSVKSRDRLSTEAWRVHVTGRVWTACPNAVQAASLALPEGSGTGADEHYALTAAIGLEYGPAFRQVAEAWRSGERVVARLRVPPHGSTPEAGEILLARNLDACLQLLIHALRDTSAQTDVAFIPVKIGRLVLHRPRQAAASARLALARRSVRSVVADCSLHDQSGRPVASLHGVRFRAVQLQKGRGTSLTFLALQSVLSPVAGEPALSFLPSLDELGRACRSRLHEPARLQARERYFNDVEPLLEAMLAAFAKEALAAAPPSAAPDDPLVRCLSDIVGTEDYPNAREIWNQLLGDHPDHAHEIIWLGRVGMRFSDLLRGAACPGTLLPPSPEFAQPIADLVGQAIRSLPAEGRGRVLCIDAGHSPSLPRLLDQLDLERCDCLILCAEHSVLEDRKALAARYPGVVVRRLDFMTGDTVLPPEAAAPFDLVVAEDGLGWASELDRAMGALRAFTRPQGVLVLAEQRPSRAARLALQILALAPGAADVVNLPAARAPELWEKLLAENGFGSSLTIADAPEVESGSCIVLARREEHPCAGVGKRGRWVALADSHGRSAEFAACLAAEMCARGQDLELAQGDVPLHWEGEVAGVIHLAGLGAPLERQAARCASAARLLEAISALPAAPAVWLVAAASHSCPDEAAYWGFATTAINEYPQLALRVADLAEPGSMQAMARVLAGALLDPDSEDEMILRPSGRQVARLQPIELAGALEKRASDPGAGATTLQLDLPPGAQLKNLGWYRQVLRAPARDEVTIEVRAAGLNFRDVMFAMGQLSDEALENGFSGPGLGMELAGVVLAAGSRASGLCAGDEVLAFAPSSFGTRVVTKAAAVVKKPAGWSFEAAASVPVAFLTGYYALHHLARLEEGQKILIHGAAGGVGIAAIQLAQLAGAEIFGTAGSEAKREFLRLLGVDHVLDSRSLAFADEIMERTAGEGVDVVLNSLAGEAMSRSLRVLRPFGRFLELGKRDFYENTRIGLRPFRNNIAYFGIDADQLMLQRPDLTRRLLQELMSLFKKGQLKPLPYRVFPASEAVEAFRYMQQSKQTGKVVLGFDPPPAAPRAQPLPAAPLALPAEATYLVSGGLRGFGLRTAQWLAEKGARHLLLVGRSGAADGEAHAVLAALEAGGVQVRVAKCDVADREALEEVLTEARLSMPPLRGVVHAAAVIEDGLIRGLSRERIEAVLAPKARGAANLDVLTRGCRLDFFVLYSSATTLFGNPGQASYVAANRYLEVLAQARRAQGLPALCVSWGPIADVGYLARHRQLKEALEARMGGSAIESWQALAVLEQLILGGASAVAVARFDRGGLPRFLAAARSPKYGPLVSRFAQENGAVAVSEDLERWLEEYDDGKLAQLFGDIVKKEIAEILRMPAEKIDLERPLQDLGLDSLMGVELMTAVEARFGINIPVMALAEVGTIERLAKRIVKDLRRARSSAPQAAEEALAEQVRLVAAQHARDIDTAQVDAFAGEFKVAAK